MFVGFGINSTGISHCKQYMVARFTVSGVASSGSMDLDAGQPELIATMSVSQFRNNTAVRAVHVRIVFPWNCIADEHRGRQASAQRYTITIAWETTRFHSPAIERSAFEDAEVSGPGNSQCAYERRSATDGEQVEVFAPGSNRESVHREVKLLTSTSHRGYIHTPKRKHRTTSLYTSASSRSNRRDGSTTLSVALS